ncbi:MAG: cell wall hydrolase [Lachnospiraceae bacterium]|nr:cell wall hydrolase [Lachnospiraceae bacterium]
MVTDQRLIDIDLLARTIHAESGNQSEEGQRAVGSVIMNRLNYSGYGGSDTIEGVISFPNQFSSYHNDDWWGEYSDLTYQVATEVYDGYTNLPEDVRCFKATYCTVEWNLDFYQQIGDHNFYYLP